MCVAGLVGLTGGCSDKRTAPEISLADLEPTPAAIHVPREEQVFLEALFPQQRAQIKVSYGLEGAGGMTGSLEVWTAAGGRRREVLRATIGSASASTLSKVEGLTIQGPGGIFRATGSDDLGTRSSAPYDRLAEAWSNLPDSRRAKALENVREWHALRTEAVTSKPGEQREIAGHQCTQTRLAGQSICLWEQEGVVLAYESEAFTLMALRVEVANAVEPVHFSVPANEGVAADPVSDELKAETTALLAAIEGGDMDTLAPLLHPGFRFAAGAPAP
jgi:hypothetical protein